MSDIFVSYSRKDMVFAQRLVARLDAEHLESWVDWAGIPYSAEWWDEICKGIYTAKNFAFIISPDSLASRVCNLELAYARQNNKAFGMASMSVRIEAPVVVKPDMDSKNESVKVAMLPLK